MAEAFRRIGGKSFEQEVAPLQRNLQNADYYVPKHQLVAELKVLHEDKRHDPERIKAQGKIFRKLKQEGRLGLIYGRQVLNIKTIAEKDEAAVWEIFEPDRKRLRRVVEKASKQIKQTASRLGFQDPTGLLILCNNGDLSLQFWLIEKIMIRLLHDGQFRGINGLLIFSTNLPVQTHQGPLLPWIPVRVPGRIPPPPEMMRDLQAAYMTVRAKAVGSPTIAVDGSKMLKSPFDARLDDGSTPFIGDL